MSVYLAEKYERRFPRFLGLQVVSVVKIMAYQNNIIIFTSFTLQMSSSLSFLRTFVLFRNP